MLSLTEGLADATPPYVFILFMSLNHISIFARLFLSADTVLYIADYNRGLISMNVDVPNTTRRVYYQLYFMSDVMVYDDVMIVYDEGDG